MSNDGRERLIELMADPWRLGAAVLCCAAAMLPGEACAPRPVLPNGERIPEFTSEALLHGSALTLHLAPAAAAAARPLVVYGSGDGGWFGAAVGMFDLIAAAGYPTAGFSSRALLKIEQAGHAPVSGEQVADSYRTILAAARRDLGLSPDAPVVLTGWSRGASLAVVAASSRDVDPAVTGIVAIGLPREDELDAEPGDDDDPPPASEAIAARGRNASRERLMYPLLARIGPRRSAVVQASGDRYLPAAQARALFGADSDVRRFFEVAANNHRFSGGRPELQQALLEAIEWAGGPQP
jgi:pimeloyl-ACP methyl ester carboxylesterase